MVQTLLVYYNLCQCNACIKCVLQKQLSNETSKIIILKIITSPVNIFGKIKVPANVCCYNIISQLVLRPIIIIYGENIGF